MRDMGERPSGSMPDATRPALTQARPGFESVDIPRLGPVLAPEITHITLRQALTGKLDKIPDAGRLLVDGVAKNYNRFIEGINKHARAVGTAAAITSAAVASLYFAKPEQVDAAPKTGAQSTLILPWLGNAGSFPDKPPATARAIISATATSGIPTVVLPPVTPTERATATVPATETPIGPATETPAPIDPAETFNFEAYEQVPTGMREVINLKWRGNHDPYGNLALQSQIDPIPGTAYDQYGENGSLLSGYYAEVTFHPASGSDSSGRVPPEKSATLSLRNRVLDQTSGPNPNPRNGMEYVDGHHEVDGRRVFPDIEGPENPSARINIGIIAENGKTVIEYEIEGPDGQPIKSRIVSSNTSEGGSYLGVELPQNGAGITIKKVGAYLDTKQARKEEVSPQSVTPAEEVKARMARAGSRLMLLASNVMWEDVPSSGTGDETGRMNPGGLMFSDPNVQKMIDKGVFSDGVVAIPYGGGYADFPTGELFDAYGDGKGYPSTQSAWVDSSRASYDSWNSKIEGGQSGIREEVKEVVRRAVNRFARNGNVSAPPDNTELIVAQRFIQPNPDLPGPHRQSPGDANFEDLFLRVNGGKSHALTLQGVAERAGAKRTAIVFEEPIFANSIAGDRFIAWAGANKVEFDSTYSLVEIHHAHGFPPEMLNPTSEQFLDAVESFQARKVYGEPYIAITVDPRILENAQGRANATRFYANMFRLAAVARVNMAISNPELLNEPEIVNAIAGDPSNN